MPSILRIAGKYFWRALVILDPDTTLTFTICQSLESSKVDIRVDTESVRFGSQVCSQPNTKVPNRHWETVNFCASTDSTATWETAILSWACCSHPDSDLPIACRPTCLDPVGRAQRNTDRCERNSFVDAGPYAIFGRRTNFIWLRIFLYFLVFSLQLNFIVLLAALHIMTEVTIPTFKLVLGGF